MSILDNLFHKKAEHNHECGCSAAMNEELFKDITQEVAVFMYKIGITRQPALSFLYDDKGFFEAYVHQHLHNPQLDAVRLENKETYFKILGMHAFGAGVYLTGSQTVYEHPIDKFTDSEWEEIRAAFTRTDAYELAVNMLHVDSQSNNKLILDGIILTALQAGQAKVGDGLKEVPNIKAYMQVLYNAGISMFMLSK